MSGTYSTNSGQGQVYRRFGGACRLHHQGYDGGEDLCNGGKLLPNNTGKYPTRVLLNERNVQVRRRSFRCGRSDFRKLPNVFFAFRYDMWTPSQQRKQRARNFTHRTHAISARAGHSIEHRLRETNVAIGFHSSFVPEPRKSAGGGETRTDVLGGRTQRQFMEPERTRLLGTCNTQLAKRSHSHGSRRRASLPRSLQTQRRENLIPMYFQPNQPNYCFRHSTGIVRSS